jgi:hypothetical protein
MQTDTLYGNTMKANPNTAITILFQSGLACSFERRLEVKVNDTRIWKTIDSAI